MESDRTVKRREKGRINLRGEVGKTKALLVELSFQGLTTLFAFQQGVFVPCDCLAGKGLLLQDFKIVFLPVFLACDYSCLSSTYSQACLFQAPRSVVMYSDRENNELFLLPPLLLPLITCVLFRLGCFRGLPRPTIWELDTGNASPRQYINSRW